MDARNLRGRDEEALPWLAAVDDEDGPPALSARKMLAALVVVLLAAAIVAGTLFWLGRQGSGGGSGPPELIRAEPGPYKVKPTDPGGLDVAGESETAFATGAGEEPDAQLDLDAVPEQPIARPQPREDAPSKSLPGGEEKVPADEPAAPPAGGSGSVIQLGFYDNGAQAQAEWDALSKRFSSIAGMSKIVVPYQTGFRLRAGAASPAEAQRACQLLKVAGENCFVVR
ncbi:SPOR domain-containing protein [Sphingomonas sp. GCM10030256]|uniref:SPOR domain-containing protein n=1 Tax=Sphingomonas sp. GCM10030256 TaxID=3273427 RepID=UPI0036199FFD